MIDLLLFSLPHTLVAVVSTGMAAAFLAADRRSATSRALAATLLSLGVGIFLNVGLTRAGTVVPRYAGVLSLSDGLAIIFYLEWLLRVRNTLPARNFDTRGGDLMLRLGQAAGAAYIIEALIWPEIRIRDFLAVGSQGWASFSRPGFWLFAAPVLFSSLMGASSTLLLMRRRPDGSESIRVLGFILAAPFLIASFVLPVSFGALSVMVGLMIVLVGAVQYHVMQGQRGQFLSRFLSPQVAEIVNSRGLKAAMQQAHIEISVVSCDLRGFTAFSTAHPSSRTIEVLRDYYNVVGKLVGEYGATIKDYAGDGILILVGAPIAIPDHARVSLEIAERIRDEGRALTKRWSTSRGRLGIGVGVASGFVTVGIIGSDSRLEYTAVGPAVNLASRLCEEARDKEILVAPRTAELAGREDLKRKRRVEVKGFRDLDEVFLLKPA
ncbi:MAG: adenylate/guanylate cyclase domain-containing protein [Stagnimonas sp.]|nr:adenylate/guanylate cyclase domain-containing protein [Stagnimonas sp.]